MLFFELKNSLYEAKFFELAKLIWCDYLKRRVDEFPHERFIPNNSFLKVLIISGEWWRVFDILELSVVYGGQRFKNAVNNIFEKENCACRFVEDKITEITSDIEIQEIEESANTNFENVNKHIKNSLKLLSDRQNPDYRNSIKESISAIEALCRNITGESTLDRALKNFEAKGLAFNPQLKQGLEKIYFYTNGEDGIRHAIMENTNITKADAKFMLVMCSAFINYIKEKI